MKHQIFPSVNISPQKSEEVRKVEADLAGKEEEKKETGEEEEEYEYYYEK